MSDKLTIVLDGQRVVEYDRSKPLPSQQLAYLDKMDADLDRGIPYDQQPVSQPDLQQKAQFIALQLFHALANNNDAVIAASCAYLAQRLPDLKQVVGKVIKGEGVACDLVFDKPYMQEASLQFHKPN